MSLFHDQMEFLQAGDMEVGTKEAERLAYDLIGEEWGELEDEPKWYCEDNLNMIKEALDLMYVTAQYLNVTIGADKAYQCWQALHTNNMSKCTNGKLVKRADGKVLKGTPAISFVRTVSLFPVEVRRATEIRAS